MLASRFPSRTRAAELWRIPPQHLEEAQNSATIIATKLPVSAPRRKISDTALRLMEVKTEAQRERAMVFRAREQLATRKRPSEGSWLARMLARKPRMLGAVALANKMARSLWAILTKGEDDRDHPVTQPQMA